MARLILVAVTLAALACGSDEKTPLGKYGEACDMANPCAQGLTCLNQFCSAKCDTAVMCQQAGTGNTCVGGACFSSCIDTFGCPAGLVCTMAGSTMGTCRP